MYLDFAKGRVGVKSKFHPNVVEFCPDFVLLLSNSGQILSLFDLLRGRTFRTGSQQTGGKRMKIDGGSGASESQVWRVPVLVIPTRARARFGPEYDSGRAVPVQSFQFQRQKRAENRRVD